MSGCDDHKDIKTLRPFRERNISLEIWAFLLEFRNTVIKSIPLIQFGFAVLGFIDGNVGAECTELWDS